VSAPHLRHCAAQHCHHTAALRSRLCAACRDLLTAHLRELPARYTALDHGRLPGTPMPPDVVEARAAIRGVLATWAHLVVTGHTTPRPARSVAGMAEFLYRHADWLGAHPAAAEIVGEITELVIRPHIGELAA
jgi:hypothetical protein